MNLYQQPGEQPMPRTGSAADWGGGLEPIPPPSPAKAPGRASPFLVMVAAAVVILGVGFGVGVLVPSGSSAAPKACTDSIERADDLLVLVVGTITLSQKATEAAAVQDVATMEAINEEVVARTPEVRQARARFDAAANACKSAR